MVPFKLYRLAQLPTFNKHQGNNHNNNLTQKLSFFALQHHRPNYKLMSDVKPVMTRSGLQCDHHWIMVNNNNAISFPSLFVKDYVEQNSTYRTRSQM